MSIQRLLRTLAEDVNGGWKSERSIMKEFDADGTSGKQVVARAAAILRALENQQKGQNLSQIARASGLPRTTVQRLVAALEAQQMVVSTGEGVRLGPMLARLANSAHTDVIALARPHVEALGRLLRETIDLVVQRGNHAISVDQYASDRELRVVSAVGSAFPLHCTAVGKVLLAEMTDETIRSQFESSLESRTLQTITSIDRLIQQVAAVRNDGFGYDVEEHAEGVCGVAVALRTGTPDRYAISVAAPATRFGREIDTFRRALTRCKASIESVTG